MSNNGRSLACASKNAYTSYDEAQRYRRIQQHGRWQQQRRRLYVYRCPHCRLWHLTKVSPAPEVVNP